METAVCRWAVVSVCCYSPQRRLWRSVTEHQKLFIVQSAINQCFSTRSTAKSFGNEWRCARSNERFDITRWKGWPGLERGTSEPPGDGAVSFAKPAQPRPHVRPGRISWQSARGMAPTGRSARLALISSDVNQRFRIGRCTIAPATRPSSQCVFLPHRCGRNS